MNKAENKPHVFVTGATGYIGNRLAFQLANEGYVVHALCRSPEKQSLLQHNNIRIFPGDISNIAAVEAAMAECSQVYHLAAFARVWAKNASEFYTQNVKATRIILDAALKTGISKTVFTSTAGVLGPSGNSPVKEDDVRIGEMMNDYETTKAQAEELCRQYVKEKNMHIVIVNPPRVYGPGIETESNAVTKLVRFYLEGKWRFLPGKGDSTGSYVHVDDIVKGHLLAMEKGRSGERYILSGENVTFTEFFNLLAEVTGKKVKLYPLPLSAMMATARLMMLRTKLTGKPPLVTPLWVKKYLYNWSLSCEKAQKELGYTYRPLREGLEDTVNWLQQKLN